MTVPGVVTPSAVGIAPSAVGIAPSAMDTAPSAVGTAQGALPAPAGALNAAVVGVFAAGEQAFGGAPPDFAIVGVVSASDPEGDPLSYTVTSQPGQGVVALAADGGFTYTPDDPAGFNGDEFTVAVGDGGFNLLDPFGERTTEVRVSVGPQRLGGYSQGFDIINLTNEVLWLTKVGVTNASSAQPNYADVAGWIDDTCSKESFCLTSMVGRSLQPGEAIPFQARTQMYISAYLMFTNSAGQNWGVRVVPRDWGMDAPNGIDTSYVDGPPRSLLPGPDSAVPVGKTPGVSWFGTQRNVVDWTPVKTGSRPCDVCAPGSWSDTAFGPVAYSTSNGNRLFLIDAPATTHTITAATTWVTAPPSWCGYCAPVTVTPQSVLNNFLAANPGAPDGTSYPQYRQDFSPSYDNLVLQKFGVELASSDSSGNRIEVVNKSGNEGVTVTKSGTVELNPGPGTEKDPSAPWWRNPAGPAAGGVASWLLGKFVGEGIATAVGNAIGGLIAPADGAKKITATTTAATITPLPHSFSVLTTSDAVSRYLVNGDVTYTVGMRGGPATFTFASMDFVVNDPTAVKDGQTLNARFETVPYQEAGQTNLGFRLSDKASWNTGLGVPDTNPTYRVDPAVTHLLGMELYLGAAANARGEDSSGQACGGEKTVNCATVSVQSGDPAVPVAEVMVLPSNQAVLIARNPGTATVTAVYNWRIDTGGAIQALTGTVKTTMGVTVVA